MKEKLVMHTLRRGVGIRFRKPCKMTCVKNNNFYGFTPRTTGAALVRIFFASCVFYTLHYIRDRKELRTVMCVYFYTYIYIFFYCAKSKNKKNYLLIFIHDNGEIIMPNFFFWTSAANPDRLQQRLYIYVSLCFWHGFRIKIWHRVGNYY